MTYARFVPALATLLLAGTAEAAPTAPVLVELFTSEGCSSCPPADAVLGELAARADVLPLAFHVTYWDQLGWVDGFGDDRWTQRQRDYARVLGAHGLYTPQAIIAGQADVVGSSRGTVLQAVDIVLHHGSARPLAIDDAGRVELPDLGNVRDATVWAVAWDASRQVTIGGGENAGRTLDYHNVVRWLTTYDTQSPVVLPLAELRRAGRSGVALVVQQHGDGKVLAIGRRTL